MDFAIKHKNEIINMYTKMNMSTYQISEHFNNNGVKANANKIRLALDYLGIPRRNYRDAQKISLDTGRSVHPTEGKALTAEHKQNVGKGRAKAWSELDDAERERLSNLSKAQWVAMSDEQKAQLRHLAALAVRETSKNGSMTENYLRDKLREAGYMVRFHPKDIIPDNGLEVDLFLPELSTAIEIDGPAHFLPIWGEESLRKHQEADLMKEGLLLSSGYVLIRVKQLDKNMSKTRMNVVFEAIKAELAKIKEKFPPKTRRLIELELKNGKIN